MLNYKHLNKKKPVAVGWSGGIDSTAILVALKEAGYSVEAWHIDHAWREECAKELRALRSICDKYDIPLIHSRLEHAKSDSNKESVARGARFDQFIQWSKERCVTTICLGHHYEDQAETVYMRFLAGSGAHGCSGIKPVRKEAGLAIVRPALDISKDSLKRFLEDRSIQWIEDPSNSDNSITRNKVRNKTFPAMANHANPHDLFNRFAKQAALLSNKIEKSIKDVHIERLDGHVFVKASDWNALSPTLRKYLLQKMGKLLMGDGFSFGKKHLNIIAEWKMLGGLDLTKTRLQRKQRNIQLSIR